MDFAVTLLSGKFSSYRDDRMDLENKITKTLPELPFTKYETIKITMCVYGMHR